jgi:hypothetical protein
MRSCSQDCNLPAGSETSVTSNPFAFFCEFGFDRPVLIDREAVSTHDRAAEGVSTRPIERTQVPVQVPCAPSAIPQTACDWPPARAATEDIRIRGGRISHKLVAHLGGRGSECSRCTGSTRRLSHYAGAREPLTAR